MFTHKNMRLRLSYDIQKKKHNNKNLLGHNMSIVPTMVDVCTCARMEISHQVFSQLCRDPVVLDTSTKK